VDVDLTGGYDVSFEYHFPECPAPGVRESSNMWVFDDRGAVGLPRFALECVSPGSTGFSEHYDGAERPWGLPDVFLNLAFPDGRAYRVRDEAKKHPTLGPDGRHSILGAGPLEFRCIEPFSLWTTSFRGSAVQTSASAMIAGDYQGPRVELEFDIEATMAVPPWTMGSLFTEAEDAEAFATGLNYIQGSETNSFRYEQLFRAKGTLRVGAEEHTFIGTGLRIRRQGGRTTAGFWGHSWQSALFPSGKAFGCMVWPPRSDGVPSFNEGWIFNGDGGLIPARVVQAPWLTKLQPPLGQDVTVVLESERGMTTIEGETVLTTFDVSVRPQNPDFPVLEEAGVRYRWDGEETYGMIERSTMRDKINWS
jgi:hypothetical protein